MTGKIWDNCFECDKELTEDMIEDIDWFDIHFVGEAFPICKECWDKAWAGTLGEEEDCQ